MRKQESRKKLRGRISDWQLGLCCFPGMRLDCKVEAQRRWGFLVEQEGLGELDEAAEGPAMHSSVGCRKSEERMEALEEAEEVVVLS